LHHHDYLPSHRLSGLAESSQGGKQGGVGIGPGIGIGSGVGIGVGIGVGSGNGDGSGMVGIGRVGDMYAAWDTRTDFSPI
jgi:hypothetical protein